mmetsp:Transcript_18110/g.47218  ORF Transcript_18110/g.47218 Transcript_18110/m.47218 type:complete len:268 (+) Transcript_18110:230-1033(+)|eukprot:CAMPEP_0206299924 /NCGR_PEP_ID=MMETSP0106_2-20121207/7435_1 /ASSEMBLY_ACC=CAM_ASM_000206 /TAXON_ID=81532 /ORGANISM="Acanthoeca-like sp., Strain 10tr" /LENGTH=267 /DNA_ID=CAMNT_0053730629 /DNA_START=133 /DNA_END=936 /DNA_ORIENTATION=+
MVKFTQIARLIDGLPLCATTEDWPGSREFKKLAKDICRMLTSTSPARLSITAGTQIFHYAIESEVIYMVLCDKGYPKANAFAYLSDIQSEFAKVHGDSVATQARPYAFIAFEQYIDKTKRRFNDSGGDRSNLERGVGGDAIDVTSIAVKDIEDVLKRGVVIDDSYNDMMHRRAGGAAKPQSTLQKVNNELSEVHRIMGKNIEQVLDRGENLDVLGTRAAALKNTSSKYLKDAKKLSWDVMVRKYAPAAAVSFIVLVMFYLRFGLLVI